MQSVQRYKFESNSQLTLLLLIEHSSCCNQYKDTNLKAIHNQHPFIRLVNGLLQSVQRYKFESNSQQLLTTPKLRYCCCNQYKDTNLKAIHNMNAALSFWGAVVAISTKIQIWKQFTTWRGNTPSLHRLLQSVQRYKFESNSQRDGSLADWLGCCCNQYKDTNLKAIHNQIRRIVKLIWVVAISTKIQIWKQFTTYFL